MQTNGMPNASSTFINYLFFNEQFACVGQGVSRVNGTPGIKNHYDDPSMQNIKVPANGYVYIYVSNESPVNVYFDNLQVIHTRGPIMEETHYYPFGLTMTGISSKGAGKLDNRYEFGGKEKQQGEFYDGSGLDIYDFGARMYDPQIGRWGVIDPLIENDHFNYTPFAYVYNDPIKLIDPDGRDTVQRKSALTKAQEYVDQKQPGDQYLMGAKGVPGEKVDCSGLVSGCIVAGGEPNPTNTGTGGGVQRIESNTASVEEKNVTSGNIVTFHFKKGYAYHTGIIVDVTKDKDGKVISFTMIHSSSGTGPHEQTVTIGEGKLGNGVYGYYKWDSTPDATQPTQASNTINFGYDDLIQRAQYQGRVNQLMRMANHADSKGLNSAAAYLRAEAKALESSVHQ